MLLSSANAFYAMTRSRSYRLFEMDVEQKPSTPSARRVRVQSSPVSSSPLRVISSLLAAETAESRAHPDKTRDVWELSVWDPLPVCLQLFCLFSPGHVLVYMLFLPLAPLDPRPSVTVFNVLVLQAILSVQLLYLQSRFSQQAKDTAIISKEVMNEYDTKFVRPRLHPVVRDVATQFDEGDNEEKHSYVEAGTPTTLIKRTFETHPNPNYVKHFDPDGVSSGASSGHANVMSPRLFTPPPQAQTPAPPLSRLSDASFHHYRSSAARQSLPANATPSISRTSTAAGGPIPAGSGSGTGLGGSLGVYTHHNSPLKKATSMGDMNERAGNFSPRNSREMAAVEQRETAERMLQRTRRGSPLKEENRRSTMGGSGTNPFAARRDFTGERYPKLR